MRRLRQSLLMLLALVVSSSCVWAQEAVEEEIVREIDVRFVGPETVNRSVVMANIQTAVGKPRSRDIIEQDVRNLINTGYFFDVRVLEEPVVNGVRVVFQVQGKATIKEIVFEGEKQFPEVRLKRESSLKVGDTLDERKAHDDAQKMQDLYEKAGYPDAQVTYEVELDKDTGKAVLKFKVQEGARVLLQAIKFTGNKAYTTDRLCKLLKTRRHWWGSWLAGNGVMKEDDFKEDLDKIRDFYHSNGYIDMDIRGTRIQRVNPHWMVVYIDLFEGAQYKVGSVAIQGNRLFPTTELEKHLKMTTGKTFTPTAMTADQKALVDYYGARGYLDTDVRPERSPNVDTGRIDMTYLIHEGELTYIEKVEIRGNSKTKDKVIRRELAVHPGEIYDTVRVDRSVERLKNLGYFSKVEADPEPTDVPNHKSLVLNLEEQRTGSVNFGAGFSSIDSLIGFVEMTQGNFDLFNWPTFTGGGQKLRLRLQLGLKRQDEILSFVEPWFLDKKLSLGFDVFHHAANYLSTEYNEQSTGGTVSLEKAFTEFLRGQIQYSIQEIGLSVDRSASPELQSQAGSHVRSSIGGTVTYDTRDSVFLTTHGARTEVNAEVAGADGGLGGDVNIYKLNLQSSVFFPLPNQQVIEVLGAARVVDAFGSTAANGTNVIETLVNGKGPVGTRSVKRPVDPVPIFDRYFLGGANTLRGFAFRQVGPKDIGGEPIGGNTSINGTIEYTYPIIERVRGAVFFDAGNVSPNAYEVSIGDLKTDAGLGLRLNLPIGPLRLDYGYPITSDKVTGRAGKFQFSVGYQF
ncbi:MAG TPA: outer membrane protein assembly factor BamA [Verrucomicrobiae bacterium]|nr:outer membrane protein assembly factor BamA [Verrucomicrobiae bacterium]